MYANLLPSYSRSSFLENLFGTLHVLSYEFFAGRQFPSDQCLYDSWIGFEVASKIFERVDTLHMVIQQSKRCSELAPLFQIAGLIEDWTVAFWRLPWKTCRLRNDCFIEIFDAVLDLVGIGERFGAFKPESRHERSLVGRVNAPQLSYYSLSSFYQFCKQMVLLELSGNDHPRLYRSQVVS